MGKEKRMELTIWDADNGVIFFDKELPELIVIPFGKDNEKSEIYKKIGEAIYEEWKAMEADLPDFAFGVEIKVSFKPIEKDVIRV